MKVLIAIIIFLSACGDNLDPCDGKPPTIYLGGEVVKCQGIDGVCIGYGDEIKCRPLFKSGCPSGFWWNSLVVENGKPPLSYCEPAPCVHSDTCSDEEWYE